MMSCVILKKTQGTEALNRKSVCARTAARKRKRVACGGCACECDSRLYDNILGHLILRPSSHRMYRSSAMGDRFTGEASAPSATPGVVAGTTPAPTAPEGPEMSSTTSVTTSPRFVISLFRVTLLCGKSPREVCTCCLTAAFLLAAERQLTKKKKQKGC